MVDDEDPEPDLKALHDEIRSHPGMIAYLRRQSVLRTHGILITNGEHLLAWIDGFSQEEHGLTIMSTGQEESRDQYSDELLRRWHNYVASTKTLVDHVRALLKNESPAFRERYDQQRREMLGDPVVPFTQGLRNFMLHKGWPNSFLRLNFNLEGLTLTIGSNTQHLLNSWDWTREQRVYLDQAGEEFLLRDSVDDYMSVLDKFYDWFWDAYTDEHAEDLQALALLHERYQALFPDWPDDVDEADA